MGCTLTLGLLHRSTERLMELRHPVTSQTGESYLDCVEGGSVSLSSLLGTQYRDRMKGIPTTERVNSLPSRC